MRQIVKDAIKHQMSKYKDEQTKRDPLDAITVNCGECYCSDSILYTSIVDANFVCNRFERREDV